MLTQPRTKFIHVPTHPASFQVCYSFCFDLNLRRCYTHDKECVRVPVTPYVEAVDSDSEVDPPVPSPSTSTSSGNQCRRRHRHRKIHVTGMVAGSPCTDFSNIGAKLRASGPTAIYLAVLIKMILTGLPGWFIHENVLGFPIMVLMQFLGAPANYLSLFFSRF